MDKIVHDLSVPTEPIHTRTTELFNAKLQRITQHADGRETDEVRYYILSRYLGGKRFSEAVRGHWGIESLHWVLDVNFREDDSRTRERTLGNNLSWLRRFAVTLLKRHPVKDSSRGKMIRCMMNTDFLTQVLTLQ